MKTTSNTKQHNGEHSTNVATVAVCTLNRYIHVLFSSPSSVIRMTMANCCRSENGTVIREMFDGVLGVLAEEWVGEPSILFLLGVVFLSVKWNKHNQRHQFLQVWSLSNCRPLKVRNFCSVYDTICVTYEQIMQIVYHITFVQTKKIVCNLWKIT